jgi:HlyD family secretion protein
MNAEVEVLVDQASDVLLVPNNAIVNLQDVGPAALALGLDPESLDLSTMLGAEGAGRAGAGADSAPPAREPTAANGDGSPAAGSAESPPDFRTMRQRVERGEISQDSARALMQRFRSAGGGFRRGEARAEAGGSASARTVRQAVVFVLDAQGRPAPRAVTIGLNDWDNTQVVSGLDGSETLAVIGPAQLQAQQQEFLNRIRERTGGSPLGGGGGPGRMR